MRKKAIAISMRAADEKEGWYLHRKITDDEHGSQGELDIRYSIEFIAKCGSENSRALAVPVHMESGRTQDETEDEKLGKAHVGEHDMARRANPNSGTLVRCRKCSGYARCRQKRRTHTSMGTC